MTSQCRLSGSPRTPNTSSPVGGTARPCCGNCRQVEPLPPVPVGVVIMQGFCGGLLGRPLNTYLPPKVQKLEYGPCAIFNHTEDYSEFVNY